jgi:hypothetical protein
MGSLLAVYYWNTGQDVLPTRRSSVVETTVPTAIRLNELVIVDLIEEEPQPQVDIYYSRS